MSHPIGIDLGTTCSAIAKWVSRVNFTGSEPYSFSLEKSRLLPSKVFIDIDEDTGEREFVFGKIAQNKGVSQPDQFIRAVKRKMDDADYCYDISGQKYSSIDISAEILKHLLRVAENKEGREKYVPSGAVVSVPYYFKDHQKLNTEKAVLKAIKDLYGNRDLKISLEGLFLGLIQEPIAAGLDYAFNRESSSGKEIILVFDLGGGTFDLTIFSLEQQDTKIKFEVLAVEGDDRLGGEDFDESFFQWICREGHIDLEKLGQKERIRVLKQVQPEVIEAKEALSRLREIDIIIPNVTPNIDIDGVRRSDFEACITGKAGDKRNYYREVASKLDKVLEKASLSPSDISYVLGVGGSSQIPKFKDLITRKFGTEKLKEAGDINLAVAKGAAIYAAYLLDEQAEADGHPRTHLDKWSKIEVSIADQNEKGHDDKMIRNNCQAYKDKVAHFKEQGGKKDYETMEKARADFDRWKRYLIRLANSFDELHFNFSEEMECETFNMAKIKYMMTFPIDMRDRGKNVEAIQTLLKETEVSLKKRDFPDKLPDSLLALKRVNVRKGSELDYLITDEDFPQDMLVWQKKSLNTLLLVSKSLFKTISEANKCLTYALENEEKVCQALDYFEPDALIEAISSKKKSTLEHILNQGDDFLEKNYKTARKAAETAIELRKKYFDLLSQTLFKVYDILRKETDNYESFMRSVELGPSDLPRLEKWRDLYRSLIKRILNYLDAQLDIEPIDCKRGDRHDESLHEIYDDEPDDELPSNRIKSVVNTGFKLKRDTSGEKEGIIMPVKVVIVENG